MTDSTPTDDLEYDLAHESGTPNAAAESESPVYVSTTTTSDDTSGDYGYDSCHDVPPAR